MRIPINNWISLGLMLLTAVLTFAIRPTIYFSDLRPEFDLFKSIPSQFNDWQEVKQSKNQIVNPQQSILINKIYSKALSRSYSNKEGVVIMLSIAYGANQSDAVALHYPEVCYPSQGFQLISTFEDDIETQFNKIPANRLITKLGIRNEPVTYWSTIGNKVVKAGIKTKFAKIQYGINGQIPDGLIFRVSSIDNSSIQAFENHDKFIRELIATIPQQSRLRLAGIPLDSDIFIK